MTSSGLPEALVVTLRMGRALELLGVRYLVCGSLASSLHGVPRLTNDADIVAELREADVDSLVADLAADFYVDADAVREAIRRGASFNAIHLETMFKVDVFVMTGAPLLRLEMDRRQLLPVWPDLPDQAWFASPEDTVISKLAWYRKGGEVSERQWLDVVGVLRIQGDRLDLAYVRRWAATVGVLDLAERALIDARNTG